MRKGSPKRQVRVVHATTSHPATDNRILRKECASLAEAGYEVHLVATANEDTWAEGVHVSAVPEFASRVLRMLLGPLIVWRRLVHLRPDVLHVHDPELIPLAILWRHIRKTPTIYDSHEDLAKQVMGKPYLPEWVRPAAARLAKCLEAAADRLLDAIVAATPAIANNFTKSTVAIVQNFPWARDFTGTAPTTSDCRTLVYVGGIAEGRGALEMLHAVEGSTTGARLLLAGPIMSDALLPLIERRAPTVEYLGDLPVSHVPAIIHSAAVGLVMLHPLPNYLESQPTKMFEYMAAGRPFIASDFPYWRRLVGGADCGVFVEPNDVVALRDAVDRLLSHPDEAAAMGARGRAAFEARFSFESQTDELVRLVEGIVE